jgi:hypothetical protein
MIPVNDLGSCSIRKNKVNLVVAFAFDLREFVGAKPANPSCDYFAVRVFKGNDVGPGNFSSKGDQALGKEALSFLENRVACTFVQNESARGFRKKCQPLLALVEP